MPATVSILKGQPGPNAVASGSTQPYLLAVTNTGAASASLVTLQVSEQTESDAIISQPAFMTPGYSALLGGFPVLTPSTTYYFPFSALFNSPQGPGPSPAQPGGATSEPAQTPDSFFTLLAQGQLSDGSVFSSSFVVSALSSIAPFPVPQGGALQLASGGDAVNFLTAFF